MRHNLQYQQLNGLGEMILSLIQKPREDEEGEWVSLKELSALIKENFKGYQEEASNLVKLGNYLNRPEYKFKSKRTNSYVMYWIKRRV